MPGDPLALRRLALLGDAADGPSDADLVSDFVARRDELAFELLVRRHGPMVLGVCRRVLGHPQDAEDAFQATFLVLVTKAASIAPRSRVGNWLYGVAHHTALKARAMSQSRRSHERQARPAESTPPTECSGPCPDDLARLDAELARLPDVYREAVVLCELEGRTLQQAARQLGCPVGTVASRLARGRKLLAQRLRGEAGAFGPAGLPAGLVGSTVAAAETLAAGGAVPAALAPLVHGVLKTMLYTKLKATVAVALLTATLGVGLGTVGSVGGEAPVPVVAAQFRPADDAPAAPPWRERATLTGHTDGVNHLAFSPDGRLIASASSDNTVRLWDVVGGTERITLRAHDDWVGTVTFSPDGKLLASAGNDHALAILDPASGKLLRKIEAGPARPMAVAFSPRGKLIGVACADGAMKVWEIASGKLVEETKPTLTAKPAAMLFTPDGSRLYSAGTDGVVRVWDATTGKALAPVETPHATGVWSLSVTPDGKAFALGGGDGRVTLWAADGKEPRVVLAGHTQPVRSVAISPDGRIVASGGRDDRTSQMRLWDATTGKMLGTYAFERGGDVTTVVFSPDGNRLVVVSRGEPVPSREATGRGRTVTIRVFEPAGK